MGLVIIFFKSFIVNNSGQMYKLSHDLSKKIDIFCNKECKMMIITTLHTTPKSLVPAALLLAHHKLKLATSNNLFVSYVVALQSLTVELYTLNIARLLAVALTLDAEYTTLDINLCLVNKWHTNNIAASSWLYRVEAESCHFIPCRPLANILIT